jgi:tetraacyldisaccharide 4'-kinase
VACTKEDLSLPEQLENRKVLALSGIGNPKSFVKGLHELKADVVESLDYPDHHDYCEEDIMDIAVKAQLNGADWVITTEKDAVKFNDEMLANFNKMKLGLCSLGIELKLENCESPAAEILRLLKSKQENRSETDNL